MPSYWRGLRREITLPVSVCHRSCLNRQKCRGSKLIHELSDVIVTWLGDLGRLQAIVLIAGLVVNRDDGRYESSVTIAS